jgi:hypothetical protein
MHRVKDGAVDLRKRRDPYDRHDRSDSAFKQRLDRGHWDPLDPVRPSVYLDEEGKVRVVQRCHLMTVKRLFTDWTEATRDERALNGAGVRNEYVQVVKRSHERPRIAGSSLRSLQEQDRPITQVSNVLE